MPYPAATGVCSPRAWAKRSASRRGSPSTRQRDRSLCAEAIDDPQWIHVDPVRAEDGPFGTTIAHGFLTLSLLSRLLRHHVLVRRPAEWGSTTASTKVRFTAPLPAGSRVRGRFTLGARTIAESGAHPGAWSSSARAATSRCSSPSGLFGLIGPAPPRSASAIGKSAAASAIDCALRHRTPVVRQPSYRLVDQGSGRNGKSLPKRICDGSTSSRNELHTHGEWLTSQCRNRGACR